VKKITWGENSFEGNTRPCIFISQVDEVWLVIYFFDTWLVRSSRSWQLHCGFCTDSETCV